MEIVNRTRFGKIKWTENNITRITDHKLAFCYVKMELLFLEMESDTVTREKVIAVNSRLSDGSQGLYNCLRNIKKIYNYTIPFLGGAEEALCQAVLDDPCQTGGVKN